MSQACQLSSKIFLYRSKTRSGSYVPVRHLSSKNSTGTVRKIKIKTASIIFRHPSKFELEIWHEQVKRAHKNLFQRPLFQSKLKSVTNGIRSRIVKAEQCASKREINDLCWSWMTRIQKRAETLVVKWTTSLFTSRGVEPVMSSQSASNKTVFNLQCRLSWSWTFCLHYSPALWHFALVVSVW